MSQLRKLEKGRRGGDARLQFASQVGKSRFYLDCLHMGHSSQPQQEFVENVFLGFLDPLLWVLSEFGFL